MTIKLLGTPTISNLSNKKYFGKKWFEFTEKNKRYLACIIFFDSKSNLKEYALKILILQKNRLNLFQNLMFGYSSLSKKRFLIFFILKLGFTL